MFFPPIGPHPSSVSPLTLSHTHHHMCGFQELDRQPTHMKLASLKRQSRPKRYAQHISHFSLSEGVIRWITAHKLWCINYIKCINRVCVFKDTKIYVLFKARINLIFHVLLCLCTVEHTRLSKYTSLTVSTGVCIQ